MLIIAALLALFTTQSPPTTDPIAAPEPVLVEAQGKQEIKPMAVVIPRLTVNGNQ